MEGLGDGLPVYSSTAGTPGAQRELSNDLRAESDRGGISSAALVAALRCDREAFPRRERGPDGNTDESVAASTGGRQDVVRRE